MSDGLVLPFDTDDPEFTRGVQVGMIYADLVAATSNFESYGCIISASNIEMMERVAEAVGWELALVHVEDDQGGRYPEWVEVVFSRTEEADRG